MGTERQNVLAIAGNPNSGKTTLFNALTGSHQRVGNWPGVTVEKKVGEMDAGGKKTTLVDLPGIYSLSSHSEDEKVARDYLLSGEASAVINIVDASNLERNLFLTLNLIEMKVPVLVVLNMTDLAEKKGILINTEKLSTSLGVPVFAMSATKSGDVERFKNECDKALKAIIPSRLTVPYPQKIESILNAWALKVTDLALELNSDARWLALKLLEGDAYLSSRITNLGAVSASEIASATSAVEKDTGDSPDAVIASAKYDCIASAVLASVTKKGGANNPKNDAGERLDKIVLNRFLGIPIFLVVMYLMFWTVNNVGGAFIDFFDISFGAIFVDGFGRLLETIGSPAWLVALLANGVGAGIQTVATFAPIMFMMFLVLAILEDSGYMARAAFVMDRALRAIGLPGKAFIPMIVGFGCSVPAIMATRTLENKRDRYLTVFMVPFMSCGARLPVYALFGAAFFGAKASLVVMSLYLAGLILAIATGFMLKKTMFRGEPAPFVMELPPYHAPRIGSILKNSWNRLKVFLGRAGKVIILVVTLLGLLNSIGTDGSIGNEDSDTSVLSVAGRAITPVFAPMGIQQDNWPATVGILTGLFAKEAVVGTLNGLYGQMGDMEKPSDDAAEIAEEDPWNLGAEIGAAFQSIPDAFSGLADSILDPIGMSVIGDDEEAVAEEVEADRGIFGAMRSHFGNDKHAAYAYLLFILIYFPCLAALGAIVKEIGTFFGVVAVTYLTVLAWVTATLYYQFASGGIVLWICFAFALLAVIIAAFNLLRTKVKNV